MLSSEKLRFRPRQAPRVRQLFGVNSGENGSQWSTGPRPAPGASLYAPPYWPLGLADRRPPSARTTADAAHTVRRYAAPPALERRGSGRVGPIGTVGL